MKKILLTAAIVCMGTFVTYAQYKPTQADVGKDCTTQNGKLGTWKNVHVEDGASNSSSRGSQEGGSLSGKFGTEGTNVGLSINSSQSRSRSSSSSEKISYDDIRCVEDKNATLPQQSPVRW